MKLLVDNPEMELMPGMICQVYIDKLKGEREALVLPVQVVQLGEDNDSFVWVNVDGKGEKRVVETGSLTHHGVVIENGLTAGEEVIVEGQQKVSEHTRVMTEK